MCDPAKFDASGKPSKRRRKDVGETIIIESKTRYCAEYEAREPFQVIDGLGTRNNLELQPGVKEKLAFLPTINGFTIEAIFERGDYPIQRGGIWPPFKEIVVAAHFMFPLLIRPTVSGNNSNPDGWPALSSCASNGFRSSMR